MIAITAQMRLLVAVEPVDFARHRWLGRGVSPKAASRTVWWRTLHIRQSQSQIDQDSRVRWTGFFGLPEALVGKADSRVAV